MEPISSANVTITLNLVAEAEEHHQDIKTHKYDRRENSDEKNDSRISVFHNVYNEGDFGALISLKKFTPDEIEMIWVSIKDEVDIKFNFGRGKKVNSLQRPFINGIVFF